MFLSVTSLCLSYMGFRDLLESVGWWTASVLANVWLLLLSGFRRVQLCATPQMADPRLPRPRDSPGKNTGVGCHFLLQSMKVNSESEVAQSCPTPRDPRDGSPPGSSVHGILQARVLEWAASAFSNVWLILLKYCFYPIPFLSRSLITYMLELFTVSHIPFTLFSFFFHSFCLCFSSTFSIILFFSH